MCWSRDKKKTQYAYYYTITVTLQGMNKMIQSITIYYIPTATKQNHTHTYRSFLSATTHIYLFIYLEGISYYFFFEKIGYFFVIFGWLIFFISIRFVSWYTVYYITLAYVFLFDLFYWYVRYGHCLFVLSRVLGFVHVLFLFRYNK